MDQHATDIAAATDDDLFESIVEEFTARWRAGERPTVAEYAARHPQLAGVLNELLPTIAAVEQAKSSPGSQSGEFSGRRKMPQRLGDYRLVRQIGYGGMGIVYEAVQESLGRPVALKILPAHMTLDPRRVARFEQEARIAAALHHTNIVPVFGVGHDDDVHYYVMQLIDGEGLDRALTVAPHKRVATRRAAEVARDCARALHHGHLQGTLHRDVKPANILLDRTGHVWLTDFGLAQVMEADVTVTAHVGGTMRYMAPERFRGESDARGDVYSLGATLYEMLGGSPAFDAPTSVELMQRITHGEPTPLRTVNPSVPRDLETIVAKAMAREPRGRYQSAEELADDLSRFLDGLPIQARRVTTAERAWRWCRRNRLSAAALAAACVSLISLSIVSAVGYWRTSQLNADLTHALDRERDARQLAESTSSTALEALDRVFAGLAPANSSASAYASVGSLSGETDGAAGDVVVPAVSPQIAAALENLLPYYLKLADQRGNDPAVRRQTASAMHRIGLIHARLGRFDEARDVWRRAAELLSQLIAQSSDDAAQRAAAATAAASLAADLGDLERAQDDPIAARAAYLQGLAYVNDPAAARGTFESRREAARIHLALGTPERKPPPAAPPVGEPPPPAGLDGLPPPPPPPPPLGPPGPALRRPPPPGPPSHSLGDPIAPREPRMLEVSPEQREHLDAAYALLDELSRERPDDPQMMLLLARCRRERAKALGDGGPLGDGAEFQAAVSLLRALCDAHPATPDFAFELSEALVDFHVHDLRPDQWESAERRLREALKISEELVRNHPQTPAYTVAQVHIHNRLAAVTRQLGRLRESETFHRRALELQTQISDRYPNVPMHALWQGRLACGLASLLVEGGRGSDAAPILEAAIAKLGPAVSLQHVPPGVAETLAELKQLQQRARMLRAP